jgi:DNA-binding MarR family transcriptional regulator
VSGFRAPSPAALKELPPALHAIYATAITEALHPVFLAAAGIAAVGFVLAWFLPEVTLKATAQAPDPGDGFHAARDANGLRELERALSSLAARDQRWEMYERLACRAELDLPPAQLWLLARLGERPPLTVPQLEEQLVGDDRQFESGVEELRKRGLVSPEDEGTITLTTAGRAGYERLVAVRRARLSELLSGWQPEQHRELEELVERLARPRQ